MNVAFLGLGSNVDAQRHISLALSALRETFGEISVSPHYLSPAVGFEGEDFINLAVRVETRMQPLELRAYLRELEAQNGRDRNAPKWSDRTLDIDILLFDDLVIHDEYLEIPRKEILKFAHVLKPLADLAPDLKHPQDGRAFAEIWAACSFQNTPLRLVGTDEPNSRESDI